MKHSFCVLLIAAGLFSQACSDPAAQMSIMADGYKQQIETKDKELAQLRESERSLNSQLAAMQATVDTLKEQVGKVQAASQGVDADKIADMIIKELEPKMDPMISASVEKTLKSATLSSAPAAPATTGRQPVPARDAAPAATDNTAGNTRPAPPAPLPVPADNGVTVRESNPDPNTQTFKFRFD